MIDFVCLELPRVVVFRGSMIPRTSVSGLMVATVVALLLIVIVTHSMCHVVCLILLLFPYSVLFQTSLN